MRVNHELALVEADAQGPAQGRGVAIVSRVAVCTKRFKGRGLNRHLANSASRCANDDQVRAGECRRSLRKTLAISSP